MYNNTVTEEEIKHRVKDNTQEIRDLTDRILFLEYERDEAIKREKEVSKREKIYQTKLTELNNKVTYLLSYKKFVKENSRY